MFYPLKLASRVDRAAQVDEDDTCKPSLRSRRSAITRHRPTA